MIVSDKLSQIERLPQLDCRCHSWPLSDCVPRSCPFCGSVDTPIFSRPDNLPVTFCHHCHCFYVALKIPDETLSQFYAQYWDVTCQRNLTDEMAIYLTSTAGQRLSRDYCLNKLSTLAGSFKEKDILDVGCGFGEKASMMKGQGASVLGIDISPEAVSFCNDKLKIKTLCTTIENMASVHNSFDIVTMFEFIEHPVEPLIALQAVTDKIKKDGFLVIVTPNGTAGERWWHTRQNEWVGFRVDLEHLQYLHVDTIDYLCHKLNYRQVHLEQFGHRTLEDMITTSQANVKPGIVSLINRALKRLPGIRRAVYAYHNFQSSLPMLSQPTFNTGAYHLFAILQKK